MSNGNYRCGICNCVSSEDIATNKGDNLNSHVFVPDPKSPLHYVCLSCKDEIDDVATDWFFLEAEDLNWDEHNNDLFDDTKST